MNETWKGFWLYFNELKSSPTVDKCVLLGDVESMRDILRAEIDAMPTRANNPIPAIEDCDDVDLRLV